MFITQLIGTIIAGIINYVTASYLLTNIPDICTPKNPRWTCPNANTFFSASIIWGAIGISYKLSLFDCKIKKIFLIYFYLGPVKMFGPGSTYSSLLYGFLIGALLPIPAWILLRKFPKQKWLKYVHFPIMLSATAVLPPAPPGNFPTWFLVGFIFNFVLARYARHWWKRYAYVFSAAMDCGVAVGVLIIFFALQNNKIEFPKWWGSGGPTGDGCPLSHANFYGVRPSYRTDI